MNHELLTKVRQIEHYYEQKNTEAFFSQIDDVLQQLKKDESHDAWITLMMHKASLYVQLYNYTLATSALAEVAEIIHTKGNVAQQIQYYIFVASLQQANGQYDEAFDTLTLAEQFAQKEHYEAAYPQIYQYMSVHYATSDLQKSLQYAQQANDACTTTSDQAQAHNIAVNLARALIATEQLDEAQRVLQTLEQRSRHHHEYAIVQAKLFVAQQQLAQAEHVLRQQIKQTASYAVQQRLYEVLCPIVKELHSTSIYAEHMRTYYDVMQKAEQAERNMQMAAIAHYFNEEEIQTIAWVDPLTHVYNRKFLTENVKEWTEKHRTFTVGIFDIDKFKSINDTYGHLVGDEVIQLLAAEAVNVLGEESLVIRYGGDEFILLWPHNDRARIEEALQQLQATIAKLSVKHEDTDIHFTISIGVDLFAMPTGEIDVLMKRADKALYEAKNNGRNQYVIA